MGEVVLSRVACVTKRQFWPVLLLPPWSFLRSPRAPPGSGERPPGPEAASVVQGLVSVTLAPEGLGSGGWSPGAPVSPRAVLGVQGLVSAPTFVRAERVGFFSAQRSPWTTAVLRCWWEVNGLDSQGSVFLGLCKPVTPVCKYVAASEPPSCSANMELSAGLAQGRCGALLGLREARTYRPSQRAGLLVFLPWFASLQLGSFPLCIFYHTACKLAYSGRVL